MAVGERQCAWIYAGIWKVLTDGFRVSRDAPELPVRPGEVVARRRPSPGWLRYKKFQFWLALVVVDVGLILAWVIVGVALWWAAVLLAPVFLVLIIVPDIIAYVGIHLRYDTTWYIIGPRSVRVRCGIWRVIETTATFENVQDVQVKQGPVQRHFGVADVVVQVAGGGGAYGAHGAQSLGSHMAVIEGIDDAHALRDAILAKVKASKSAGLGDEARDSQAPAGARAGAGWSAEHIAVLREIAGLVLSGG